MSINLSSTGKEKLSGRFVSLTERESRVFTDLGLSPPFGSTKPMDLEAVLQRAATTQAKLVKMDEDLRHAIPCSSLAVDSILRVGTAGAIWGSCIGPYDARKIGLTGPSRAAFVAKSAANFGFKCGMFSGIFSFTRCGLLKYRKRDDWVNNFVAGAVAGAAVAARTRSWTQVIGMAGLISVFGVAADYSRSA